MRTPIIDQALLHALSPARLGTYMRQTDGTLNAALGRDARRVIGDALNKLRKSEKDRCCVPHDDVIAELNFGFWVSLLGPGYDSSIWRRVLASGFREQGRGLRRDRVQGRLNMLRRIRNRVAHHAPVIDHDIARAHAELIEAIAWMCADTAGWTAHEMRPQ